MRGKENTNWLGRRGSAGGGGVRDGKEVELDHNTLYTCVKLLKKLKFGATKMF